VSKQVEDQEADAKAAESYRSMLNFQNYQADTVQLDEAGTCRFCEGWSAKVVSLRGHPGNH